MNQKFISENYCENKAVENSKCQGSCFLLKEIDKHSDENSKSTLPKLKVEDYIIQSSSETIFISFFINRNDLYDDYKSFQCSGYKGSIFHPPLIILS